MQKSGLSVPTLNMCPKVQTPMILTDMAYTGGTSKSQKHNGNFRQDCLQPQT